MSPRLRRASSAVLALALVVTACGDDGNNPDAAALDLGAAVDIAGDTAAPADLDINAILGTRSRRTSPSRPHRY
jgi:hypothetical protein